MTDIQRTRIVDGLILKLTHLGLTEDQARAAIEALSDDRLSMLLASPLGLLGIARPLLER